jgi:hypothetical protein
VLYKEETGNWPGKGKDFISKRPPHCEEFKACLQQALKILEERYEV